MFPRMSIEGRGANTIQCISNQFSRFSKRKGSKSILVVNSILKFKIGILKLFVPFSQCITKGPHIICAGGEGTIKSFGGTSSPAGDVMCTGEFCDVVQRRLMLFVAPCRFFVLVKEANGAGVGR